MLRRSALFFAPLALLAACSYGVDSYTVAPAARDNGSGDVCEELLDAGLSPDAAIATLDGADDGACAAEYADAGSSGGSGGAAGGGTAGNAGAGGETAGSGGSGGESAGSGGAAGGG